MNKPLKSLILSLGLALPIVSLTSQEVLARELDFRFHNHTPYTIARLYVSASDHKTWEEDVLGERILYSGDDIFIHVPDTFDTCYFDIKVVFTDESYIEENGFNLCELTDITIP
jgi:hypothetical protein